LLQEEQADEQLCPFSIGRRMNGDGGKSRRQLNFWMPAAEILREGADDTPLSFFGGDALRPFRPVPLSPSNFLPRQSLHRKKKAGGGATEKISMISGMTQDIISLRHCNCNAAAYFSISG
jgi:hypothetical protein